MNCGFQASAIRGKASVSAAAKNQWVKLPSDCPNARCRLGKISLVKTQITAPWPTACAAINAKMHTGTMPVFPEAKAHEVRPSEAMYPKEPM